MLLDPGYELTLRPMKYPIFYDYYKKSLKNTWSVEEIDFSTDLIDLRQKLTPADQHLIRRLVAFFATGDTIVSNNLVLNLYKHINSPEARMFLSRQLFEEALHIEFYLTLLDNYIPDSNERHIAFSAIQNIPSIHKKAQFAFSWIHSIHTLEELNTREKKKQFLLNLICFAACIEGLFFFAAFAYVYFLRSRGLLHGLATGTNWVFRDESMHMNFAFQVVQKVRQEEPSLFDQELTLKIHQMFQEAVECEFQFSEDLLSQGVMGLSSTDMRQYLQFIVNQRCKTLQIPYLYPLTLNPFSFMDLQDVEELTNFFERRVSSYQVGISGKVTFDQNF